MEKSLSGGGWAIENFVYFRWLFVAETVKAFNGTASYYIPCHLHLSTVPPRVTSRTQLDSFIHLPSLSLVLHAVSSIAVTLASTHSCPCPCPMPHAEPAGPDEMTPLIFHVLIRILLLIIFFNNSSIRI